jgi:hypothetical protein
MASSSLEAEVGVPSMSICRIMLPSPDTIFRGLLIGSNGMNMSLTPPGIGRPISCLSFSIILVSLRMDPDCRFHRLAYIVNGRPLWKIVLANGSVTSSDLEL